MFSCVARPGDESALASLLQEGKQRLPDSSHTSSFREMAPFHPRPSGEPTLGTLAIP